VRSTIDLGHNLDLEVVAEGVENQGTWERLVSLECDSAQGFFIGEPMPTQEFRSWSAQWRCAGPAGLH
jgi:EAL domain-containing protein (putative c-di-GMP-specific phosphodiesterase class I)